MDLTSSRFKYSKQFAMHISLFQFNRASIIGAIVKVLLKSFIESIRLQTYGKFAVEQIQAGFYLQYLCRN